jgi:hypothetical protein
VEKVIGYYVSPMSGKLFVEVKRKEGKKREREKDQVRIKRN